MKLRRALIIAMVVLAWLLPGVARADGCLSGCGNSRRVCTMQVRIGFVACIRGCAPGDLQCRLDCRDAMVTNRLTCRSQRMDCATSCSPAMLGSDSASACAPSCGTDSQTCSIGVRMGGIACLRQCLRGGPNAMAGCLEQCAATLRNRGASCAAGFQGCLEGCGGQESGACFDTITKQCTTQACNAAQPCSQPSEFCSPRCAPGPSSGQCFDTVAMQCTDQACASDQPCALPNQVCLPQCPPPTPSGKCFDTVARQCTDEACSPGQPCSDATQVCTLQCPPPPPSGQCFDVTLRQCTDLKCGPDQPCPTGQRCLASCPLPTPTPQCGGDTCGGRCYISPCPPGAACADFAPARIGQCELSASGDCECVPYVPPTPTPTPTGAGGTPSPTPPPADQCGGDTCGGKCVISPPCPSGGPCPEYPSRPGQCEPTSAGDCECVPYAPPTPTPQCGGDTCGGRCYVSPCPPGAACADFAPARIGQCELSASGACECVPDAPPTPVPQCGGDVCGGPCSIPPPCPPGQICPAVVSRSGQCETTSSGTCECVPYAPPTPTAPPGGTPTPAKCAIGQCVSTLGSGCTGRACGPGLASCFPNEICDLNAFRCPCLKPPQPCASGADCDDGNACTIDRCTSDGCMHDCVCVGPLSCGPGPMGN